MKYTSLSVDIVSGKISLLKTMLQLLTCCSYKCITQHLAQSQVCPVCKSGLALPTSIHPNFTCEYQSRVGICKTDLLLLYLLVNSVVARYKQQHNCEAREKVAGGGEG